ncbi:MAG: hypothetical protein KDA84_25045, partial [Planctomycetaceae bacterium]|nr:hypothetical protein [Planctomycetaceae bacterium]
MDRMKKIGVIFVLGVLISMTGNGQEIPLNEEYGIEQGSSNWSTNLNKADRIPGIDQASITRVKLLAGPPT